jgi:hypothetical protein
MKRVLDATCSISRRWPQEADVRVDINPSAKPDVVADARYLPFRDGAFSDVYCDPPHLVGFGEKDRSWNEDLDYVPGYARFSKWKERANWIVFMTRTNAEFARVLRTEGLLHYKIPDGTRSHGRMIDAGELRSFMSHFQTVSDVTKISDGHMARINRKQGKAPTIIHYLTMQKTSSQIEDHIYEQEAEGGG